MFFINVFLFGFGGLKKGVGEGLGVFSLLQFLWSRDMRVLVLHELI